MTAIRELAIAGYRSLRSIRIPLAPVTIVVGANGSGKTNLYQALRLIQAAAQGTLARSIAAEGGLPSMLWAGERSRSDRGRVELSIAWDDLDYALAFGLVPAARPRGSPFDTDPEVKEERVRFLDAKRPLTLLERAGPSAFGRDAEGQRVTWPTSIWAGESVLSQVRDPGRFRVLAELAARLVSLRFYHSFAIDASSPIRAPQVGVRTPRLSDDGHDLAAAIATVDDIGDGAGLRDAIARALRADVRISASEGVFSLRLATPGLSRPLEARELSDGTLRFLCLATALTSPRPPAFLALNEPESSLHPDVLPALAERIASAARASQILVTTHSRALADAIVTGVGAREARVVTVERGADGATRALTDASDDDE